MQSQIAYDSDHVLIDLLTLIMQHQIKSRAA